MTVTSQQPAHQHDPDHRRGVARTSVLSISAIGTGIATIIVAGGNSGIEDGTIRYGITTFGICATVALLVAALYVWLHYSRDTCGGDQAKATVAGTVRDEQRRSDAGVEAGAQ